MLNKHFHSLQCQIVINYIYFNIFNDFVWFVLISCRQLQEELGVVETDVSSAFLV